MVNPTGRSGAKRILGATIVASLGLTMAACAGAGDGGGAVVESPTADAAPFYEGKTIELIVPSAAGTGNDTTARWLAPLLAEYIPGKPKVQVINVEGAGAVTGANQFAEAEPDGLSFFVSGEANTTAYLLGGEGVAYDYADWAPLLGMPLGSVVFMRPGAGGVEDREDILDADATLILGGEQNAGTTSRALTLDLLGVDYQLVTGYSGNRGEIALQQGEIDISGASTGSYLTNTAPLAEEGKVLPLYSMGYRDDSGELVSDPAAPDLPNLPEYYEMLHDKQPSGDEWDAFNLLFDSTRSLTQVLWTHGDAPEAAIAAANEGIEAMKEDPAYIEGIENVLGGYEPVSGDPLYELVDVVLNPDPATLEWLKEYVTTLYGG